LGVIAETGVADQRDSPRRWSQADSENFKDRPVFESRAQWTERFLPCVYRSFVVKRQE